MSLKAPGAAVNDNPPADVIAVVTAASRTHGPGADEPPTPEVYRTLTTALTASCFTSGLPVQDACTMANFREPIRA